VWGYAYNPFYHHTRKKTGISETTNQSFLTATMYQDIAYFSPNNLNVWVYAHTTSAVTSATIVSNIATYSVPQPGGGGDGSDG
jgi:hypothetical protein